MCTLSMFSQMWNEIIFLLSNEFVKSENLKDRWGTGMIASSSTFRPNLGGGGALGICSVSCLLYGMVRKH